MILGNGSIGGVDVEWLPVPDKDILYYRVYRSTGSNPVLVNQTSGPGVNSYTDRTVPANPTTWSAPCSNPRQAAASQLYYYVVAVDQSGPSPREGARPRKSTSTPATPPEIRRPMRSRSPRTRWNPDPDRPAARRPG